MVSSHGLHQYAQPVARSYAVKLIASPSSITVTRSLHFAAAADLSLLRNARTMVSPHGLHQYAQPVARSYAVKLIASPSSITVTRSLHFAAAADLSLLRNARTMVSPHGLHQYAQLSPTTT
jgi:hypothetical protein